MNPPKARGTRLGTQLRGKLSAAYGQRGAGSNSLWYVYSPRSNSDWVLRSDLEWDHFVLTESDPSVASCDFLPKRHKLSSDDALGEVVVDATICYHDGRTEWRRVRFATPEKDDTSLAAIELSKQIEHAGRVGVTYKLWTEDEIRSNHLLLANWRRAIAWMAAARDRSLAPYELELGRVLQAEGELTLGEIEATFGEAMFAMYAAAAFHQLQRGTYVSTFAQLPLSRATAIRPA